MCFIYNLPHFKGALGSFSLNALFCIVSLKPSKLLNACMYFLPH